MLWTTINFEVAACEGRSRPRWQCVAFILPGISNEFGWPRRRPPGQFVHGHRKMGTMLCVWGKIVNVSHFYGRIQIIGLDTFISKQGIFLGLYFFESLGQLLKLTIFLVIHSFDSFEKYHQSGNIANKFQSSNVQHNLIAIATKATFSDSTGPLFKSPSALSSPRVHGGWPGDTIFCQIPGHKVLRSGRKCHIRQGCCKSL